MNWVMDTRWAMSSTALSANDISAGNYVIGKSATAICGKNAHAKLNSGNCAMVVTKANFTNNKNSVCLGEFIAFTDSSLGNITAYSWDFGAGAVPATANTIGPHNVRWTTGGSKTVTLTITTIVGNLVKTKNVSISTDQNVGATFDFALGGKGRVTFTNTSKNPTTSKWYFGDGDSSVLTSPVHDYDTGGTYFVTLKAGNSCSNEMSIKGIDLAWLNFYTPGISACINEPVLYLDSSDGRVAIWQWAFTGGTPATATGKGPHYVIYNSPGNKSVSLAISNTKGMNQLYSRNNIISISNDTFTKASFKFGYYGKNMVGFENTSGGSGMTYKWYFGDGDSSTLKNPIHQYSNANNKNVRLIVKGNCGTHDTTIQLRDFTSLTPVSGNQVIKLFPNPVDKEVFIKSLPGTALLVQLFDLTGKMVLESKLAAGETLSTENVENGVYILKLVNETLHETFRLVVQH
jgi:PKD repeat protein